MKTLTIGKYDNLCRKLSFLPQQRHVFQNNFRFGFWILIARFTSYYLSILLYNISSCKNAQNENILQTLISTWTSSAKTHFLFCHNVQPKKKVCRIVPTLVVCRANSESVCHYFLDCFFGINRIETDGSNLILAEAAFLKAPAVPIKCTFILDSKSLIGEKAQQEGARTTSVSTRRLDLSASTVAAV